MSRYQIFLAAVFGMIWVLAAIDPVDRGVWMLENVLVVAFIPLLVIFSRYIPLSNVAYTLITIFLVMHVAGSYWTYGEVPLGRILQDFIGSPRNMYDRVVHFAFGLLFAYPLWEMLTKMTGLKGFWSYVLPVDIVFSFSALFEIFEWIALALVDNSVGTQYLAAQGDIFDAAKDMACAGVGGIIAILITLAFRNRRRDPGPGVRI